MNRLLISTKPFIGESFPSFIYRLAWLNHVRPRDILNLCGFQSTVNMWKVTPRDNDFELKTLSEISRCDLEELIPMFAYTYWSAFSSNSAFGKMLIKYCPMCIERDRYHKGEWQPDEMRACCEHRIPLQTQCNSCEKQVSFDEVMANSCECGKPLSEPDAYVKFQKMIEGHLRGVVADNSIIKTSTDSSSYRYVISKMMDEEVLGRTIKKGSFDRFVDENKNLISFFQKDGVNRLWEYFFRKMAIRYAAMTTQYGSWSNSDGFIDSNINTHIFENNIENYYEKLFDCFVKTYGNRRYQALFLHEYLPLVGHFLVEEMNSYDKIRSYINEFRPRGILASDNKKRYNRIWYENEALEPHIQNGRFSGISVGRHNCNVHSIRDITASRGEIRMPCFEKLIRTNIRLFVDPTGGLGLRMVYAEGDLITIREKIEAVK